jgi:C4-dicarboxylate-specific signal transduction histidine kinase
MAKSTKIAVASHPLSRFRLALIQHFSHRTAIAIHRARSEEASKGSETFLALASSIALEIIQPLKGTITNANAFLRMLATDPPSIDGTRETARRAPKNAERACDLMRTDLASDLPHVRGDRVQLQQVVLNLVANGSEAMSDVVDRARHLRFRTQRHDVAQVHVTVREAGIGVTAWASVCLSAALLSSVVAVVFGRSRTKATGLLCRSPFPRPENERTEGRG